MDTDEHGWARMVGVVTPAIQALTKRIIGSAFTVSNELGHGFVELKAMDNLGEAQAAQLINYLKASSIPVGLLLNFGRPKLQIKRVIL